MTFYKDLIFLVIIITKIIKTVIKTIIKVESITKDLGELSLFYSN
jgi:hypothetical protein